MNIWRNVLAGALFLALSSPSWASDVTVEDNGSTTWQAGVDGPEIDWKPDGSIRRISCRQGTPVEFGDRRAISKAQIISEEKAKACIIRFKDPLVSSSRVVTEVQTDLNKATQERQTGTDRQVKKVDERTLVESLKEATASFASGQLRGIIVLEKGYDNKADEAWVVVGYSEKTLGAARALENMNSEPRKSESITSAPDKGASALQMQPSEVRRLKQKDW